VAAEAVEVTASRTPTGLDADAVEAAVRAGESCVVAQLRQGNVVVSALPALAEGACLVGAAG
jgi:predicted nuclease of predicted toxin-antitoxin system